MRTPYSPGQIARVKQLLGYDDPPPTPPEVRRSKTTFKEIAMLTDTRETFVSAMALAADPQIFPPSKKGEHRTGRPKGIHTKLEPRSPHREPAYRLLDEGKTPPEIAAALNIKRQYAYKFRNEWMAAKQAGTWPPADGETKKLQ
jgi:hypothetical protein